MTLGTLALGLVAAAAGTGLMLLLLPPLTRVLRLGRRNFAGETVSAAGGLAVWLPAAAALGWGATRGFLGAAPAFTAVLLFGLLGLADDLWGDRSVGGFRGHIRQLVEKRRVTTGLAKLALGGGASLVLGLWLAGDAVPVLLRVLLEPGGPAAAPLPQPDLAPRPAPGWVGLLDALTAAAVIALSANTLNLLDLRPLRALKAFASGSLLLGLAVLLPLAAAWLPASVRSLVGRLPAWIAWFTAIPEPSRALWIAAALLGPALLAALLYAPLEARRRAMLGDSGANALGALLGVAACVLLPLAVQVAAAIALAAVNLYAETHSLSALIHAHPLLNRIDRWGWKEA